MSIPNIPLMAKVKEIDEKIAELNGKLSSTSAVHGQLDNHVSDLAKKEKEGALDAGQRAELGQYRNGAYGKINEKAWENEAKIKAEIAELERQKRDLLKAANVTTEEKIDAAKDLMSTYKKVTKGHPMRRLGMALSGKKPTEKALLKRYTEDELRQLDSALKGNTKFIHEKIERSKTRLAKDGASIDKMNKETAKIKFEYFKRLLGSKVALERDINIDKGGFTR